MQADCTERVLDSKQPRCKGAAEVLITPQLHGIRLGLGLLLVASLALGLGAGSRQGSAQAGIRTDGAGEAVVSVTAGENHSCALLQNGTIRCWGGNSSGQLGDGTTTNSPTPVEVKGIDDAIDVSAGDGYTCALLRSHTMRCWGSNKSGELGDGTTTERRTPVMAEGVSDVRGMSTNTGGGYLSGNSTCALLASGKISCWGASEWGELGDYSLLGSDEDFSLKPVTVTGITNAVAISDSTSSNRCAALETGEVECWGADYYGYGEEESASSGGEEEGPNSNEEDSSSSGNEGEGADSGEEDTSSAANSSPTPIRGISGAKAVVIGEWTNGCVLTGDGSVDCWSLESDQTERIKGVSGAIALTYGEDKFCALLSQGTASCWEDRYDSRSNPEEAKGLAGAVSFDGGIGSDLDRAPFGGHFCAVVGSGEAECWGDGYWGELGNGVFAHHSSPVVVTGTDNATSIGTGAGHTCASFVTKAEGSASSDKLQVACWGANQLGQLGDAKARHDYSTKVEASPLPVLAVRMDKAIEVAVGWWHACALVGDIANDPYSETPLVANGSVWCWGAGRRGQLGLGRYLYNLKSGWIMSRHPRPVKGLKNPVAVSAGGNVSCVLLATGEVDCWGGWFAPAPTAVPGIAGATAISVARDGSYMCAIVASGQVECWSYELRDYYSEESQDEPTLPPSTIEGISGASAVDATSACAVVGGIVQCWSPEKSRALASVSGVDSAVGLSDNCALLVDGHVACWKTAAAEEDAGEGAHEATYKAQLLEGITDAVAYSADINRARDETHECILVKSGKIECWGDNDRGELGNGELPFSDVPVPVIGLSLEAPPSTTTASTTTATS